MNQPIPGDFADVVDKANRMSKSAIAHPFGASQQTLAQGPRLPIQQTTQLFYLPKDVAAYDECCNRLWAGDGRVRYEDRTFTKEGEVLIILSYFTDAPPDVPRDGNPAAGIEEPEVRPYRIP